MADGDGRYVLTMAEQILAQIETLDTEALMQLVSRRAPLYDKKDDGHYNLISALHKSVRGSDVDASLYWLARMLAGGEDPRYLARRIARMAVEDIGMADPQALPFTLAAWEAYERMGSPEGELRWRRRSSMSRLRRNRMPAIWRSGRRNAPRNRPGR